MPISSAAIDASARRAVADITCSAGTAPHLVQGAAGIGISIPAAGVYTLALTRAITPQQPCPPPQSER